MHIQNAQTFSLSPRPKNPTLPFKGMKGTLMQIRGESRVMLRLSALRQALRVQFPAGVLRAVWHTILRGSVGRLLLVAMGAASGGMDNPLYVWEH